jgi:hypothetical protein
MVPKNSDITQALADNIKTQGKRVCDYLQLTNHYFSAAGADNDVMKNWIK